MLGIVSTPIVFFGGLFTPYYKYVIGGFVCYGRGLTQMNGLAQRFIKA
jgi:hypothetical protein